jgi:Ni/Fe-hydrogenase 1 B-type cytochrome subunit
MSERKRVYVWEIPVRLFHWLLVISMIAFTVTGLYIGNPYILALSSKQYIMGTMRFIHFVVGYLFLMIIIVRIYWSLVGNKYAHISGWFPFTGKKIGEMGREIKCYALMSNKSGCEDSGHTALGGLVMLFIFLVFFFEIVSGFAMYSVTHSGAIWTILGGWLLNVMLLPTIKLWHHLCMYVIIAFTIIHVYTAIFLNSIEGNGLLESIFTGYKFED